MMQKIKNKINIRIIILIILLFIFFNNISNATSSNSFPISISNWEPIALIAVLIIIAISAFIYMLSRFMFNTRIEAWAKMQMYEAFLSFIILLIFVWISSLFFLNPMPAFSSAHLLPSQCSNAKVVPKTLFQLSACDLSVFNNDAETYFQVFYWGETFLSFSPGINASIQSSTISKAKLGDLGVSSSISSVFPKSDAEFITLFFESIVFMLILNQIQLMLISSALLFLSLFLVIGLIARIFGVTRGFGGAMIALGIGLGLVYPLLTAITYGFITTQIGTLSAIALISQFIGGITGILSTVIVSTVTPAIFISGKFALNLGYIIGGLTFMPFLNFLILDAFIIDFSSAMGERMEFMSLLSGLI